MYDPISVKTYLLYSPARHLVKVGRSLNVDKRHRSISTATGEKLKLLAVIDGDEEKRIHDALGASRQLGEWFAITDAARDILAREFRCKIPGRREKPIATSGNITLADVAALCETRWHLPLLPPADAVEDMAELLVEWVEPYEDDPGDGSDPYFNEAFYVASICADWTQHLYGYSIDGAFLGLAFEVPPGAHDRLSHRFWSDLFSWYQEVDGYFECEVMLTYDNAQHWSQRPGRQWIGTFYETLERLFPGDATEWQNDYEQRHWTSASTFPSMPSSRGMPRRRHPRSRPRFPRGRGRRGRGGLPPTDVTSFQGGLV